MIVVLPAILIDAVHSPPSWWRCDARRARPTCNLMLATGWQPHSVRGAISGLLRKRLGLNVVLARNAAGERVYRIGPAHRRAPQGREFSSHPWGTREPRTLAVPPVAGRFPGLGPENARQLAPALGFGRWPSRRRQRANRKPCKPRFAL